jgi:hypothetical protein
VNINVHIERLVIDGIAVGPAERPRLQAAVATELQRLLAEGGIATRLATGGTLASVRGGALQLPRDAGVAVLGQRVAQAVYGGIGR